MANVRVKDLISYSITGSDLFSDSESFIQDLSDREFELQGGKAPRPTPPIFKTPAPTPPIFKP